SQLRQPFPLQRVRSIFEDRLAGSESRAEERRAARHRAAGLRDQPKLDQAHTDPAELFGDADGGPALLTADGPERLVIFARSLEQVLQLFRRELGFELAPRFFGDLG